ncbi:hypothetical protein K525DRAFT_283762 [Schizophyllum commune Loenen D]|nr:hypothetical protein K525DRAFT_283762 [Schizophyllum commune Loenen D]
MTRITNIGIKRAYVNADPPPGAVDQDDNAAQVEEPPKKKKKSKHDAAPESTDPPAKKTYRNKAIAEKAQRSEQRRLARIAERNADTTCFACREKGHSAKFCSKAGNKPAVGICYRCGSTRHSLKRCKRPHDPENPFPFATCFVCNSKGHLASACEQNQDKGIYPNGGCCKLCGENTHLAKDCALRKPDVKPAAVIGFAEPPGADEDDFHTLGRLNKQLDRAEKVDTKKKKQADVKTGVVSGITKSFAPAPVKKKKVVVF